MIRRPPSTNRTDTLFPYTTLFRSRDAEHQARVDDGRRALTRAPALQPYGDSIALEGAEEHGAVARILIELLAAALAFLLQRAQRRAERGRKLNDDGGGDIGHHAKRDHRHTLQRAAGEHVAEVQHAALGALEKIAHRNRDRKSVG